MHWPMVVNKSSLAVNDNNPKSPADRRGKRKKVHGTLEAMENELPFWIPAPATAAYIIACTSVGIVDIAASLDFEKR